ncbi:MAG: hypothetical protein ACLRZZ_07920 [Enterocloster sp.]
MKDDRTIILIADYCGTPKENGEVPGHFAKVLREYRSLLNDEFTVDIATAFNAEGVLCRNRYILEISPGGKVLNRYQEIVLKVRRISRILSFKGYDIIWFLNTDYLLFLILMIHPDTLKKVIFIQYEDGFKGKKIVACIKNTVYHYVMKRAKLVICTNRNLKTFGARICYMPDYYYDANIYEKYRNIKKDKVAVCLGTMHKEKDLEGLIEVFNKLNIELEICGYFSNEDWFNTLKSRAKNNITMQNRYIGYEEYLEKMASAKYVILPYNMNSYYNRPSGVLVESVFVRTIPVAPNELLRSNEIDGIGYKRIQDLTRESFDVDWGIYHKKYDHLISFRFSKEFVKKQLIDALKN